MRVLIATDGSAGSDAAADLIRRLPLPANAELTVVHVIEGLPPSGQDPAPAEERRTSGESDWLASIPPDELQQARALLERSSELLARTGGAGSELLAGDVVTQVLAAAERFECDLIVAGARGRGRSKHRRLGSVARELAKRATCDVLLARPIDDAEGPRPLRILVALDSSESSAAALATLASMPLGERAEVTLLTVLTVATTLYRRDILERTTETWQAYKAEAEATLVHAAERLASADCKVAQRLIDGGSSAHDEILDAVRLLAVDVVVAGHSDKGRLATLFMGSVSNELLETAPCSVWIATP